MASPMNRNAKAMALAGLEKSQDAPLLLDLKCSNARTSNLRIFK